MPKPAAIGSACGRALRRSAPLLVVAGAVAIVGGAVFAAHRFVTTSPRFAISAIEIRGTQQMAPALVEEIRASLPVKVGDNIFSTDLEMLGSIARRHPWIAHATVERELPDTLVVDLREHEAAAIAVLDVPYLVDREGHPFKRASLDVGDGKDLPVVTGLDRETYRRDPAGTAKTIVGALGALAQWQADASRPAIGEVRVDGTGALTFRTYDRGTSVQLGVVPPEAPGTTTTVLASRMRTFDAAWHSLSDEERARARAIHLDARTDHVTVALKD